MQRSRHQNTESVSFQYDFYNFSDAETQAARRMFRKVQQHVEMMVEMFKRAKFTLSVAVKMRYDENFQLKTELPYLLHWADHMSCRIENSEYKNGINF